MPLSTPHVRHSCYVWSEGIKGTLFEKTFKEALRVDKFKFFVVWWGWSVKVVSDKGIQLAVQTTYVLFQKGKDIQDKQIIHKMVDFVSLFQHRMGIVMYLDSWRIFGCGLLTHTPPLSIVVMGWRKDPIGQRKSPLTGPSPRVGKSPWASWQEWAADPWSSG